MLEPGKQLVVRDRKSLNRLGKVLQIAVAELGLVGWVGVGFVEEVGFILAVEHFGRVIQNSPNWMMMVELQEQ